MLLLTLIRTVQPIRSFIRYLSEGSGFLRSVLASSGLDFKDPFSFQHLHKSPKPIQVTPKRVKMFYFSSLLLYIYILYCSNKWSSGVPQSDTSCVFIVWKLWYWVEADLCPLEIILNSLLTKIEMKRMVNSGSYFGDWISITRDLSDALSHNTWFLEPLLVTSSTYICRDHG